MTAMANLPQALDVRPPRGRTSRVNDLSAATTRYYYDGVNEIVETDAAGNPANQRSYVHGVSYVDERLMMLKQTGTARPYYYVLGSLTRRIGRRPSIAPQCRLARRDAASQGYCVWLVLDRAGAVVERYAYDEYGRPLIRESAGRGDMNDDTDLDLADQLRVSAAQRGTIWDPRADLDDDGDVDATDVTLYATKDDAWPPQSTSTTVAQALDMQLIEYWACQGQAFSDVGNPFGFQGRVHFALDTIANATDGKLMLVDHRNRMNDPVAGRWITRDPLGYTTIRLPFLPSRQLHHIQQEEVLSPTNARYPNIYVFLANNPSSMRDPLGLNPWSDMFWGFAFPYLNPGFGCWNIWGHVSLESAELIDYEDEALVPFGCLGMRMAIEAFLPEAFPQYFRSGQSCPTGQYCKTFVRQYVEFTVAWPIVIWYRPLEPVSPYVPLEGAHCRASFWLRIKLDMHLNAGCCRSITPTR